MCTATVVRLGPARWRVAVNRDERRTRAPSTPPVERSQGPRRAIFPIDPPSGGTWIAANDAGLCLALLNVNPAAPMPTPADGPTEPPIDRRSSRGAVIPALLHHASALDAWNTARELDRAMLPPFRLLLVDDQRTIEARFDVRAPEMSVWPAPHSPVMLTSSGLGDTMVEAPRRKLFQELFCGEDDPTSIQDRFHRHRWPDRPEISVNMSRTDARTESFTIVEVSDRLVELRYQPNDADDGAVITRCALNRAAEASCPS